MIAPEIIICSPDAAKINRTKQIFGEVPHVSFQQLTLNEATHTANLDAMWISWMMAVEYFRASPPYPPFPLYEARIFNTPENQMAHGLPRYGVAGVQLSPTDPQGPPFTTRMIILAMLKAIRQFNNRNEPPIARIGFQPEYLIADNLSPKDAAEIIRDAYLEVFGSSSNPAVPPVE
jgi:hypothetical protein